MSTPCVIHGKCKVVPATEDHIEALYPFIRKADQLEVACMGHTPQESLTYAFNNDDVTLTALDEDDVPFAMFGAGKAGQLAYIWLLGTEGVNDNAYDFLKASRKYTQDLVKPYGCAFNFVHHENKVALKWLRFCGATFIRSIEFSNQTFYEFIITSKQYV